MKKLHHLFTILPLFYFYNGISQPSIEWTATTGPDGIGGKPRAMCIDHNANIYVTGPGGNGDYVTIKYTADGVQKWVATYNGEKNGDDYPFAITVDGAGNVYVTGRSMGIGGTGKKANLNYATVKYNDAGVQQWVAIYRGILNDEAHDIKVDGQGVYVTGFSKAPVAGASGYAITTIKYRPSDGFQLWAVDHDVAPNDENPANIEEGNSLVLDVAGNVYVAGRSVSNHVIIKYNSNNGALMWPNAAIGGGGGREMLWDGDGNIVAAGFGGITKIDPAGNVIWSTDEGFWDIVLDATNNVYAAGSTSLNGDQVYNTVKYNSDGVEQWAKTFYGDLSGPNFARFIAVGPSGSVYVTGYVTVPNGSNNSAKIGTVKYDASGNEEWVEYASVSSPGGFGVEVDGIENVYVTGELNSRRRSDFFTVKYSQGTSSSKSVITAPSPETTSKFYVKNYPNPFIQNTTIEYQLPNEGKVRLTVYDLLGHQVAILVNGTRAAGTHLVNFSANKLSPGTYFYKIQFGEMIETRKLVIIR